MSGQLATSGKRTTALKTDRIVRARMSGQLALSGKMTGDFEVTVIIKVAPTVPIRR